MPRPRRSTIGRPAGVSPRLQQPEEPDEVVGCDRQREGEANARRSAKARLALSGGRFHPAEHLLDALADTLAGGVAGVPGDAPINGGAPAAGVLCDVRGLLVADPNC